jgi:hypothetical protein
MAVLTKQENEMTQDEIIKDLESLTRHSLGYPDEYGYTCICEVSDGDYVLWEDVLKLIKQLKGE